MLWHILRMFWWQQFCLIPTVFMNHALHSVLVLLLHHLFFFCVLIGLHCLLRMKLLLLQPLLWMLCLVWLQL